tara:strand:- start:1470 stop:2129 length:660 start_codon:yes stop_codon:yes gene_type:complete
MEYIFFWYLSDLIKADPKTVENQDSVDNGEFINNMDRVGSVLVLSDECHISVGFRTFPTFELYKLSVERDESCVGIDISDDEYKMGYETSLNLVKITAVHELEHLYNYTMGISSKSLDEFTARCPTIEMEYVKFLSSLKELDEEEMKKLNSKYNLPEGIKFWESYFEMVKTSQWANLDLPGYKNSLGSIFNQIENLEYILENFNEIIDKSQEIKGRLAA